MSFGELIKPVRVALTLGILLQGLGAVTGLIPLIAIVELATVLMDGADESSAWSWLWIAVAGVSARLATVGLGVIVTHFADSTLSAHLRKRLAGKVGQIPIGEAQRRSSGQVKKLITDDVATLHTLVAHAGGDMVITVLTAIASLIVLAFYSWPIALLALVPILAFLVAFGSMMGKAVSQFDEYDKAKGRVSSETVEFARGIAVVKTFGQAGRASAQYHQAVDDYTTFFARWMGPMINGSAAGLAIVAAPSVLAVMAAGGLTFLVLDWTDLTGFVAGLVFGVGLALPLTQMESYSVKIRAGREAAERIGSFLAITPLPRAAHPRAITGQDICLDRVSMRYSEDSPLALDSVALQLPAGTITALVGGSGAGKSTCASLISRFWDPTSGAITLGGTNLKDTDPTELYESVGFLFQGTRLVPMTVADNIRLGRPSTGQAEVEHAARLANIHERILDLPRGYDSVVGQDVSLSGGEAQRVAIARVLLQNAPVLLLDEATSFADPENQVLLQRALARAAAGKTTVVIAHRLGTITDVDQIAVMDAGRLVEVGSHADLLAARGTYHQMWAQIPPPSQEKSVGTP